MLKIALSIDLVLLGVFTLIYMAVNIFVGIIIISRYFQLKSRTFLYAGIGFIGVALPWSGVAINFLSVLLFNTVPPLEVYFFFHGGMSSIFLFIWLVAIMNLTEIDPIKKKKLLVLFGVIAIIMTIVYNSIVFTDTSILGTPINEIQMDYALFSEVYLLTQLIIVLISGYWLSKESLKSEDNRVRLKGKLIAIGFGLFGFASIIEVLIPLIPVIITARILLVITAILIYAGLILPKWLKRLVFKELEV